MCLYPPKLSRFRLTLALFFPCSLSAQPASAELLVDSSRFPYAPHALPEVFPAPVQGSKSPQEGFSGRLRGLSPQFSAMPFQEPREVSARRHSINNFMEKGPRLAASEGRLMPGGWARGKH